MSRGAYSVEAANPRHEHEWKIWRDVKLPEGKILIPGVVSHASSVVEHPELVADRIVLYAGLVGRENVIAGTDCGLGFRVHPQIAWAKLKALTEGAALATKQLGRIFGNALIRVLPAQTAIFQEDRCLRNVIAESEAPDRKRYCPSPAATPSSFLMAYRLLRL
jgi:hypothetical protein